MYGLEEYDYRNLDTFNGRFQEGSRRHYQFTEYMLSQGFSSKENEDYDREALMRESVVKSFFNDFLHKSIGIG